MHVNRAKKSRNDIMRRGMMHQLPWNVGESPPQSNPEMNWEISIQLSVDQYQHTGILVEEQQHHTSILLSTVKKLQEEMVR